MNGRFGKTLAGFGGPLLFALTLMFVRAEGLSSSAVSVLGVTIWMAVWWICDVVDIAVTALLPIVLFPLSGALDISATTASYGHKYVFLYMGGFFLAIAIEKWNLHRRIALTIIHRVGSNISRIVLGFMLATAFMSMWISNTATSVMMLPIGIAIVSQLKDYPETDQNENEVFGKMLMLSIAYSASIGGMATLFGTPPNLVFAGVVKELYDIEITFSQWIKIGLPISLLLLGVSWIYLTRFAFRISMQEFPGGRQEIKRLKYALGKMSPNERTVGVVFLITALCLISRQWIQLVIPAIDDTIIAMSAGVTLCLLPSSVSGERILEWQEAVRMPWGVLLLFGGGMALAAGFTESGLADWIGGQFSLLEGLPLLLLIVILVLCVNFLTEITSNLATTAMLLPILAAMAGSIGVHPFLLLVSATLAASCAFMLPVATPPNAVVFGSGLLKIGDMTKTGFWMNVLSVVLISLFLYYLLQPLCGSSVFDILE
ncbi:MAG: SLC13 family permease [Bacteroidota bacterium]